MKILLFLHLLLPFFSNNNDSVKIEKALLYDQHTLADTYPYKDTVRVFQWDKIRLNLEYLEAVQKENTSWAILQNYKNINGIPALVKYSKKDEFNSFTDTFGVKKDQSIPLYLQEELSYPSRYAKDGFLVKLKKNDDTNKYATIRTMYFDGEWQVLKKYVKPIMAEKFNKVIFVDRNNQNIVTLEKVDSTWYVRSMNPVTTGLRKPPYQRETPLGIFVIQGKKKRMDYYRDGTTEIGGFSPYASRFSGGGYLHGIPVNKPRTETVEFSQTLGTTPRSHMCVRNATSHAEFIYNWAPIEETLVFVIE